HFDHIRYKIREKLGMVRHRKSDFLLVQLLDAVLDNYFETIDAFNLIVAELEKEVLKDPTQSTLLKLEKYKKDTQLIKKSLMPFKEALTNILNGRTNFIENENEKYFHDLLNSCKNAMDEIESTSKSLESLANIYFSSLSQKMNETMKVLTTVATIFIPLTFIAGIYGMNFEYMPELKYRYGYFVVWGVMGAVLILMLLYFKRKKWL
ncbi:MAG: CorA family divalent cation transporter, partial [Imperialibacter sp.]